MFIFRPNKLKILEIVKHGYKYVHILKKKKLKISYGYENPFGHSKNQANFQKNRHFSEKL